jgi:hypothetical protein
MCAFNNDDSKLVCQGLTETFVRQNDGELDRRAWTAEAIRRHVARANCKSTCNDSQGTRDSDIAQLKCSYIC